MNALQGQENPWAAVSRTVINGRATIYVIVTLIVSWEVVGQFELVGRGAFPALSSIIRQLWVDRSHYPIHLLSTVKYAMAGFIAGNLFAIAAAIVFTMVPAFERLFRGILIAIFSVPLIVLAPIVGLSFSGDVPRVVLSALAVYFPTLVNMRIGLAQVDQTTLDIVRGAGGRDWMLLRKVRLRSSIPNLFAGLRVAAPWAILGSMLAEFLGGRWGLGVFMLGSMGQALPERLWGIGLVATSIAALGYLAFSALGQLLTRSTLGTSYSAGLSPSDLPPPERGLIAWLRGPFAALFSVGVTLAMWKILLQASGLPAIIASGPIDVFRFLFLHPEAAIRRSVIIGALGETAPSVGLGLGCGLAAAFGLAVVLSLRPTVGRSLLPFALLTQTMPLVALTPLIVLVFGRGTLAIVAVTISVTFFPSFVAISHGLSAIPSTALDLFRGYRASSWIVLRKVSIPSALPYLLAAARLAAPRALLGVMLAEYLATGTGLGFLLAESRGKLDFRMMWAIAVVTATISVLSYLTISYIEHRLTRRFALVTSE